MTTSHPNRLFDLTRTDDQRMSHETMQRFADVEIRSIARSSDEAGAAPEGFYDKSAELGLALLSIPEALGGAGMERSPVSSVLNIEDLATGDLGLTLGAISPQAFVNTLIDQGSDAQRERYLPLFCDGTFVAATTALMEPRAMFDPVELHCTATETAQGYTLNGNKCLVPLGVDAQLVLVIAALQGQGTAAFIVEGSPEGMTRTAESNMGLRTLQLATLDFDNVQLPLDSRLGNDEFDLQRFIDLSRLGIGALAVGTCQAVLDYVKEYVNERIAFGEPISNRQSVAFMVADMATELEAMRLMVWRAASLAEQGLEFHQQAYLAHVACGEYAMKIGTDGVQLLGGHGFCREHPVEMWYRNLRAIAILDGVASA
ncbi:MAG: acyl-CoA dehydrogenase family protein [Halioglobus sp.]